MADVGAVGLAETLLDIGFERFALGSSGNALAGSSAVFPLGRTAEGKGMFQ
jgi:hypothetical protein